MEKMKFLSALWMSKRSNTLSLIHLEDYKTPLVFQKLKLNNHNMDYIMRSEFFILLDYYYNLKSYKLSP